MAFDARLHLFLIFFRTENWHMSVVSVLGNVQTFSLGFRVFVFEQEAVQQRRTDGRTDGRTDLQDVYAAYIELPHKALSVFPLRLTVCKF